MTSYMLDACLTLSIFVMCEKVNGVLFLCVFFAHLLLLLIFSRSLYVFHVNFTFFFFLFVIHIHTPTPTYTNTNSGTDACFGWLFKSLVLGELFSKFAPIAFGDDVCHRKCMKEHQLHQQQNQNTKKKEKKWAKHREREREWMNE